MEDKHPVLCPNCQSKGGYMKSTLEQTEKGFTVCGLCKGSGSVKVRNESYSTVKTSWITGRRSGLDVTRLIAIPNKEPDFDFHKLAQDNNTEFLGFTNIHKTIKQNDVNSINY